MYILRNSSGVKMRGGSTALLASNPLCRLFSGNNDAADGNDSLVHCQEVVGDIVGDGDTSWDSQVAGRPRAVVD